MTDPDVLTDSSDHRPMNLPHVVRAQFKRIWPALAALYIPTLLILLLVAVQDEIPPELLLRDVNSLAEMPFFTGALSNIGNLCWAATAAVCFFCYTVLRRQEDQKRLAGMLLYAAILTSWLLADDLFELHEEMFRHYLPVPESIIYTAYVLAILVFLVRYRALIWDSEFALLFLALGFLGLSLGTDVAQGFISKDAFLSLGGYVLEDGFKLFGIISWLAYFARLGSQSIRRATIPLRMSDPHV